MKARQSEAGPVDHLDFLHQVHDQLRPRTYLEIGVRHGHSLALSSAPSIGIDPTFEISDAVTLGPQVALHKEPADAFFAAADPLAELDPPVIDLAFVSRVHEYESVLRGYLNIEKHTGPGSVVIIDDVLPRAVTEATRTRQTRSWTGDVWKIVPSLRAVRPDLILLLIRTTPGGLLLVLGADLTDTELAAAYQDLLAKHVASGESEPPAEIITRATAVYPTWVVGAPFWEVLRRQRELGTSPAEGRAELLAALQRWTSTMLNDRQARTIHPSLTGKPAVPQQARSTAERVPAAARRRPGLEAYAGHPVRRALNGVHWRVRKVIRLTKRAIATHSK